MKKLLMNPLMLLGMLGIVFLSACNGDDDTTAETPIPVILSVSPESGEPGDEVTITGTDLGGATSVVFGDAEATIGSNSETEIVTTVPENAVSGTVSVETPGGTAVSSSNFEVIIVGAASISEVSRISAQVGENVTLTGTEMATVSSVSIGGVETSIVSTTDTEVEVTVGESPLGLSTITVVNDGGTVTTTTEALTFYVIEVLQDFNDTFDGETQVFSSGGDAEISAFGISNIIEGATMLPPEYQANFYHIEGESDLDDSGSYTGQVGHSTQDVGYFADFFAEGSDISEFYFNINMNFGTLPADYDDLLAGLRLRFDEGYDADGDGSTGDEYLEFRPTPSVLSDMGYSADENGWYSLNVNFQDFLSSGPRDGAGSWAVYDHRDMTRYAISSRREHPGAYSLSLDNIFITRGGPYSFPE